MKTTVVNCKTKDHDVYIGRPSKWGNPFCAGFSRLPVITVNHHDEAIERFKLWIGRDQQHLKWVLQELGLEPPTVEEVRKELQGKRLGCWCKPAPCHGDILARIADGGDP